MKKTRNINAIILGYNYYKGLSSIIETKPIGKLKVFDNVLIERLIQQLHEADIVDITLITGYKAEEYDYLKDKYEINLVHNPNYKDHKIFDGLHYVVDKLNNTYVVNSNTYLQSNPFVYDIYESLVVYDNKNEMFSYGYFNVNETKELRKIFYDKKFTDKVVYDLNIHTFFRDQVTSFVHVSDLVELDENVIEANKDNK